MPTFKTKDGKTVTFKAKGETPKRSKRRKKFRMARAANTSKSRARPRTTKRNTMARRYRRSQGRSSSGNLTQVLLGGAVAGFLGSLIPYGNYGKLGAALVGHKQGGIVGNTAKALGVIGAANLVSGTGMTASTAASAVKW